MVYYSKRIAQFCECKKSKINNSLSKRMGGNTSGVQKHTKLSHSQIYQKLFEDAEKTTLPSELQTHLEMNYS